MLPKEQLKQYQTVVAKYLRDREIKNAKSDPELLQEAQDTSDIELLRKWLWKTVIIASPICFLLVPFVISALTALLGPLLATILWNIARVAMALDFSLFCFAIYFTTRETLD
jgi:hypothetical protein